MRRRMVYCGTESALVVVLEILPDGTIKVQQQLANSENPHKQRNGPGGIAVEWVALHPCSLFLYAFTCFWDKRLGEVISYKVDQTTGLLSRCGDAVSTHGYQPCHTDFSSDFCWLAVAHYLDGVVSILDCRAGAIAALASCVAIPGQRSRMGKHTGPLAHGVRFTPNGTFLAVCDAGQGMILIYTFDTETGKVCEEPVASAPSISSVSVHGFVQRRIVAKMGARPRHIAFHPFLPMAYVVTELGNAVGWHNFDPSSGKLGPVLGQERCIRNARVETECASKSCLLPSINFAAEIAVSGDGKLLYVSNRGFGPASDNSIVVFRLDQVSGRPSMIQGANADRGPRHFSLFKANNSSDAAVPMLLAGLPLSKSAILFAVDEVNGTLDHIKTSLIGHALDCVQVLELTG